jgi:hypothetical protein
MLYSTLKIMSLLSIVFGVSGLEKRGFKGTPKFEWD